MPLCSLNFSVFCSGTMFLVLNTIDLNNKNKTKSNNAILHYENNVLICYRGQTVERKKLKYNIEECDSYNSHCRYINIL